MARIKNLTAAVMLAAGALLLAGCMADVESGPAGERAFGLTETETGAARGCAGIGGSLSGSVTLSVDGDVVWMIEDGRPRCVGTLEEVQGELLAYESRLQELERLEKLPSNQDEPEEGRDHDDLFAPAYDPNPVPAGESHGKIESFSSPFMSGSGDEGPTGPIPDPNPVPALTAGVQIGSQDEASSSGDSDDDDPSGGPRFNLALLTASFR